MGDLLVRQNVAPWPQSARRPSMRLAWPDVLIRILLETDNIVSSRRVAVADRAGKAAPRPPKLNG